MKKLVACLCLIAVGIMVHAQTTTVPAEKRVGLSETAVALDSLGASALEGMLKTSGLNGTPEAPVTNVRFVVRNTTSVAFGFVSGIVTFYDSSAVRCGGVIPRGTSCRYLSPGRGMRPRIQSSACIGW